MSNKLTGFLRLDNTFFNMISALLVTPSSISRIRGFRSLPQRFSSGTPQSEPLYTREYIFVINPKILDQFNCTQKIAKIFNPINIKDDQKHILPSSRLDSVST